ncbi:MAG: DEAD/DEAH box helicase family protein, partial [Myxococcota bacterium]
MATLTFEGGTICLSSDDHEPADEPVEGLFRWDPRTACFRAPAHGYAATVLWFKSASLPLEDRARGYVRLEAPTAIRQPPFPYQSEALQAWKKSGGQGVVVLPTGSGKTFLATMAIDSWRRSTLVVVPTIDLMNQWYDLLAAAYDEPIGILGGGYHEVTDMTVTTYDSAHIHMERIGHRFGMVIFDECHHLPSETYAMAARSCLAPFRLGLTATPERTDGGEALFDELIGPVVYRRDIDELSGSYLADYETQRIPIPLTDEERQAYEQERGIYIAFLRRQGIHMGSPSGWQDFIIRSSRSDDGRRAFTAYRRQRQLAQAAAGKLAHLARLLHAHRNDRAIIFTEDNATVYRIAREFLIPAITHQTKVKERS